MQVINICQATSHVQHDVETEEEYMKLRIIWKLFSALSSAIGVYASVVHVAYLLFGRIFRRRAEYWIHPSHVTHPLCVRLDSSDINVFHQIFVDREYSCLDNMSDVRLIIDCGANVGYSSAYFLSRYPGCQIVSVEPEPCNFEVLQRNLAAYGDRAKLVHAGVWSCTAPLIISQDKYRDGREWTKQVRLCGPDEAADVDGVDIGSLLFASGQERISLLKVDIEGAEAVVFSEAYQSWLDKVDIIAIELHDDSLFGNASQVFFSAISGQGFQISHSGELTICRRTGSNRCNE